MPTRTTLTVSCNWSLILSIQYPHTHYIQQFSTIKAMSCRLNIIWAITTWVNLSINGPCIINVQLVSINSKTCVDPLLWQRGIISKMSQLIILTKHAIKMCTFIPLVQPITLKSFSSDSVEVQILLGI